MNSGSSARVFFALALFVFLSACVSDDSGLSADDGESTVSSSSRDNYQRNLQDIADRVIVPAYRDFVASMQAMADNNASIAQYCDAIGGEQSEQALGQVRENWRTAMALWQQAEAFLIGPVADNDMTLRNRIYAWPATASRCAIDRNVQRLADSSSAFDIGVQSIQSRGLAALEYLLFNENLEHSCPVQITETADWENLETTLRQQRRCEYARLVAQDVLSTSAQLLEQWASTPESFREQFIHAGEEGSQFSTQLEALNLVTDALFYIESSVKDLKLGVPTGISAACEERNCAPQVESPYSRNALENIRNNLIGFEKLFLGGSNDGAAIGAASSGLAEVLARKSFPDMAQAIVDLAAKAGAHLQVAGIDLASDVSQIDSAAKSQDCINASANPDTIRTIESCALYGDIKKITDAIKGDFLEVINLSLPARAESDND